MKKILITGAQGFVGSYVSEVFINHGYDVVAYGLGDNHLLLELGEEKNKHIQIIQGDICDKKMLTEASKDCEGIIHLAALKSVQESFSNPLKYKSVNVEGTKNVFETAYLNKIQKVIFTSSSEVYGQPKELLIKEEHPLEGLSPYAKVKIQGEVLAKQYMAKGLNITILRPTNIFGPRQSTQAVIPIIITQMVRKQKELKIGLLSPTVDFNYVEDVANAFYLSYINENTNGETFNVCTGISTSIGEIADYVIEKVNPNAVIVCDKEKVRVVSDANKRIAGDNSKLRQYTDWQVEHTIWQGIDLTIKYIKEHEEEKRYEP